MGITWIHEALDQLIGIRTEFKSNDTPWKSQLTVCSLILDLANHRLGTTVSGHQGQRAVGTPAYHYHCTSHFPRPAKTALEPALQTTWVCELLGDKYNRPSH